MIDADWHKRALVQGHLSHWLSVYQSENGFLPQTVTRTISLTTLMAGGEQSPRAFVRVRSARTSSRAYYMTAMHMEALMLSSSKAQATP
jgi:hypothetical protein